MFGFGLHAVAVHPFSPHIFPRWHALLCLFCPKGCSLDSRLVLELRLIVAGAIAKTTENFLHCAFNLQHLLLFRVWRKLCQGVGYIYFLF